MQPAFLSLLFAKAFIAVYLDSLVMISIERSEKTPKYVKDVQEIFYQMEFIFHNFSIKHDILRLFAKKKKSNIFLDLFLDLCLDFLGEVKNFFSKGFFFTISLSNMTFKAFWKKKKKIGENFLSPTFPFKLHHLSTSLTHLLSCLL